MNKNCHTILLKCDREPLPKEDQLRAFVAERLASPKTEIEYYGCEADSGWDYIDEHLQTAILKACYITFEFEEANAPDYSSEKDEVKRFMSEYFREFESTIIVEREQKDISVYFE